MDKLKSHIIYLVIIAVLLVVIKIVSDRPERVIEVVREINDTVIVTKYDTLIFTNIIENEKRVVDTVYLESNNNVTPIPISEYRFNKENEYDITAYGYNVSLSNVTVYPKTEYKSVTNVIEKEVQLPKVNFYGTFGFASFNDEFYPNIGLTMSYNQNLLISANIGYLRGNAYYYATLGYKIKL